MKTNKSIHSPRCTIQGFVAHVTGSAGCVCVCVCLIMNMGMVESTLEIVPKVWKDNTSSFSDILSILWHQVLTCDLSDVIFLRTLNWVARLVGNEGPSTFTLVYWGWNWTLIPYESDHPVKKTNTNPSLPVIPPEVYWCLIGMFLGSSHIHLLTFRFSGSLGKELRSLF